MLATSDSLYISATFWVGVVLAVLALATIVVSIWLWRRGGPKRVITYRMPVMTPLLSEHVPHDNQVAVILRREDVPPIELPEPYFVRVQIRYRGARNIRRSDFDDDRPLIFRLGAGFSACTAVRLHGAQGCHVEGGLGQISIGPVLIKRGMFIEADFVTDGKPDIRWQGQLAEVEVREETERSNSRRTTRYGIAGIVIGAVTASVVGNLTKNQQSSNTSDLFITGLAVALALSVILVWAFDPSSRPRFRRRS